jgi:hypothetical protein
MAALLESLKRWWQIWLYHGVLEAEVARYVGSGKPF